MLRWILTYIWLLLYSAIGVRHHGNKEVDKHDDCEKEVGGKHQLEHVDGPWLDELWTKQNVQCSPINTKIMLEVYILLVYAANLA